MDNPTWTVESGIPIPPAHSGKRIATNGLCAAFAKLEVGESIFSSMPRTSMISAYASVYARKGYTFVSRAVDGGTRVWRIR